MRVAFHAIWSIALRWVRQGMLWLLTVLTYCEVHSIPAVLYVCYTRSVTFDTDSLAALRLLCQSPALADVIVVSTSRLCLKPAMFKQGSACMPQDSNKTHNPH